MVPLTVSLTNGGTAYLRAPSKAMSLFLSMSEEGVTPFLILESIATMSSYLVAREPWNPYFSVMERCFIAAEFINFCQLVIIPSSMFCCWVSTQVFHFEGCLIRS